MTDKHLGKTYITNFRILKKILEKPTHARRAKYIGSYIDGFPEDSNVMFVYNLSGPAKIYIGKYSTLTIRIDSAVELDHKNAYGFTATLTAKDGSIISTIKTGEYINDERSILQVALDECINTGLFVESIPDTDNHDGQIFNPITGEWKWF